MEVPDKTEFVSNVRDYLPEASEKVSSRSNIRNLIKTPPVLHVSFWSLGRTLRLLMNLEVVSDNEYYPSDSSV